MIKAIIIDDELKAQKNLFNLLKSYCPEVDVMAMENTIEEGVSAIQKFQPEVVFLDIEMDGETGFDLFESIEEVNFNVIFITAHDEYAIKAFKFNAMDYLLKPIDIDELQAAVNKIVQKKSSNELSTSKVDHLLNAINNQQNSFEKIVLPTLDSLLFINIKDIVRCEATDNYTNFHLIDGKVILVSKSIKHYEEILENKGFYRVHRSHLINIAYIKEFIKGDGGYLMLTDSSNIPVARRKRNGFLSQFEKE
ncbi:MAG: DNA-binding response regulator [Crocinitomicaceae bacterium]|nr:DNA-binding response regulator [Crocinitomicaceae bacterium]|tara:strand:+ start:13883 stop:14635 length:753 start_codon:yes stop_codon:yes gene_type:complete